MNDRSRPVADISHSYHSATDANRELHGKIGSAEVNVAEKNGYFRVLEMLIRRLHQTGLFSADEFSSELEAEARSLETGWAGVYAPGTPRDDVLVLLQLASSIKSEYALPVKYGKGVGADIAPPANGGDEAPQ